MFITTFYSYKGGVGRTMALINTAYELAKKARRVLVVDFDLEAPGLTSYADFKCAASRPGIVEYVTAYIETGNAPDVRDYITECQFDGADDVSIFVMPAGRRDAGYSEKYAKLDWQDLYANKDGFIFFEDLKQQWQSAVLPSFDYVLIDSRTGHTDIGGICTRQLPDAVVLMFYPNTQNIDGLCLIADDIRRQAQEWKKRENLVFCPSNVPDLDDEMGVLEHRMTDAAQRLGYGKPDVVINHYSSLDLVDQVIFLKDRPKTKLASQYRGLASAVVKLNREDKQGAVSILEQYRTSLQMGRTRGSNRSASSIKEAFWRHLDEDLNEIQRLHPKDGEIAWRFAEIYNELGDVDSEINALTNAIEQNFRVTQARRSRADRLIRRKQIDAAIADLRAVAKSLDARPIDVFASLSALAEYDSNWRQLADDDVVNRLDNDSRKRLAMLLHVDRAGAARAAEILAATDATSDGDGQGLDNELMLALIGAGRFSDAMQVLPKARESILISDDIQEVFNYAMAAWGESKRPQVDLLMRVMQLHDLRSNRSADANYFQCIALTKIGLGDFKKAIELIDRSRAYLGPGRVFSCWTYLYRARGTMLSDLSEMEATARGSTIAARFAL